MSKIDREQLGEWLSAYVDGELNAEQEKLIERLLREDEGARTLLGELRRTVSLVSSLPRHRAPSSIAEDIQFHVERADLLGGVDEPGVGPAGRRSPVFALLSMAAMLALVAGSFWMMWGDATSPTGAPGDVVAVAPGKSSEEEGAGLRSVERLPAGARRDVRGEKRKARASKPSSMKRRETAERTSAIGPPLPAVDRGRDADLVATATLDQKIIAGLPLASLRAHRFDNEPVRLKVRVRSEAQRDAVTARLIAYLSQSQAADLADVPSDGAGRPAPSGTYYHQGDPEVNFTATDQHQILVHASPRQLDGMMSELADAVSTPDSVALVAGPLSIRGLDRARQALRGLDEATATVLAEGLSSTRHDASALPAEALEKTGAARSNRPLAGGDELFGDLVKLVQLDADVLAQMLVATGHGEPGESTTPTAQPVVALTIGETKEPLVGPPAAAESDEPAVKESKQETYLADADLQDVDQESLAGVTGSAPRVEQEISPRRGKSETRGRTARPARKSSAKKAKPANGDGPPSLVDRRLREIEESRRRRKHTTGAVARVDRAELIDIADLGSPILTIDFDGPAITIVHNYLREPGAENYVTLIVQVIVAEPRPRPPIRKPKPPRKPSSKRRLEDSPAE